MVAKKKIDNHTSDTSSRSISIKKCLGVGISLSVLMVATVIAVKQITRPDVFPIHEIRFVGTFDKVDVADLNGIVEKNIDGNFFTLDVRRIHRLITDLPWVNFAWIDRKWPGILQIRVVEEKAVAIWRDEKLINAQGKLFVAGSRDYFPELPVFFGEANSEKELMKIFALVNSIVQPAGLSVSQLSIDARHAIKAKLDNSIELFLGRDNFEKKLMRFVRVYGSNIAHLKQKISRVDLRYSNGFSLLEKEIQSVSQIQQMGVPSV